MKASDILSDEAYTELKARNALHIAFVDSKRGANGWASYKPEEEPLSSRITNEELSKLEVYDFITNPPDHYLGYVHIEKDAMGYVTKKAFTTWVGDTLSTYCLLGHIWTSNLGDKRQRILFKGINGILYGGIFYLSSGDYARVKKLSRSYLKRLNII
jgi:hypothetical protein